MTPQASPPFDPLDLTLHIGSGKTGTSSIQYFLHQNRERLAESGYLYPRSPGRMRHSRLSLFIKRGAELTGNNIWGRQDAPDPVTFRRVFRRKLFAEIQQSGLSRVVMSDEALFGSSDEALRRLRRFTDRVAGTVRLVAYLRRQDDHLVSRYQQRVKFGEVDPLADRVRQADLVRTYDYHARLRTWQRLLEPTRFVVRRFERVSFVNGSLYEDFLEAAGLDLRAGELDQIQPRNESLDADAVEFLRLLNLYRVEHEGVTPSRIDNRDLLARLSDGSTGPTLTLPAPVLEQFMAQWEESNRAVAREFLGDESGELFRSPRRGPGTTTEQHLDPSRIDHYVTLLELPERMHAPLRRIAEREAARAGP